MPRYCKQCGHRNPDDSRFCEQCGVGLAPAASPAGTPPGNRAHVRNAAPAAAQPSARPSGSGAFRLAVLAMTLAVVAGIGYLYATPYLALRELKAAFDRKAFRELGGAMDVASLKKNLKDSIANAKIQVQKDDAEVGIRSKEGLDGLEALLGFGIDQGLDKLLSPEALGQLEAASAKKEDVIAQLVPENRRGEIAGLVADLESKTEISTGYAGIDAFEVRASHPKLGKAVMVLTRQGLAGWRVSGVDLGNVLPTVMRRFDMATSEVALADAALWKKDIARARAWAERAAEQELPGGSLRLAMVMIGAPSGRGDAMEGIKRASHVAAMGDASAALMLARVYESGLEVPEDAAEAVKWYKRAFELQANTEVASRISWIYTYGRKGVPQDYREAAEWARRAADWSQGKHGDYRSYFERRHVALSALVRGDEESTVHKRGQWMRGGEIEIAPGEGIGPVRFELTPAQSLEMLGDCDSWSSTGKQGWCGYVAWNWGLTLVFDLDASALPVVIRSSRQFPRRLKTIAIFNPSGQTEESPRIGGGGVDDALQRLGAEKRRDKRWVWWCPLQKEDVLANYSLPLDQRWLGSATAFVWPSITVVRCDGNGRVARVELANPAESRLSNASGVSSVNDSDSAKRGAILEVVAIAGACKTSVQEYVAARTDLPSDARAAGCSAGSMYAESVSVVAGQVAVRVRNVDASVDGRSLYLTPTSDSTPPSVRTTGGGPILGWHCGTDAPPAAYGYFPAVCRQAQLR